MVSFKYFQKRRQKKIETLVENRVIESFRQVVSHYRTGGEIPFSLAKNHIINLLTYVELANDSRAYRKLLNKWEILEDKFLKEVGELELSLLGR